MEPIDIQSIINKYSQPTSISISHYQPSYPIQTIFTPYNKIGSKLQSDTEPTHLFNNNNLHDFSHSSSNILHNYQYSSRKYQSSALVDVNPNLQTGLSQIYQTNFAPVQLGSFSISGLYFKPADSSVQTNTDKNPNYLEDVKFESYNLLNQNPYRNQKQPKEYQKLDQIACDQNKPLQKEDQNTYFRKIQSQKSQNHSRSNPNPNQLKFNFSTNSKSQLFTPQTDIMGVFGSSKLQQSNQGLSLTSSQNYPKTHSQKQPHIQSKYLPLFEFNSHNLPQTQSNAETQLSTKPTTQYWNADSGIKSLKKNGIKQNHFQSTFKLLSSKQPTQYRKLQPGVGLKPNKQGFIPLHKTKEQIQYEMTDINSAQMEQKKVYDRLQIGGRLKNGKQEEFATKNLCGWKNPVIYEISTNDDNRKNEFWGKWC